MMETGMPKHLLLLVFTLVMAMNFSLKAQESQESKSTKDLHF